LIEVSVVVDVFCQVKEDADGARLENELRSERLRIINDFNEASHTTEMRYDKAVRAYVAEVLDPSIGDINAKLKELRDMRESTSELYRSIAELLDETNALIRELHSELLSFGPA
jgi:hypothetical protein